MELSPTITIHLSAALGALATGPVALWARQGRTQRPRLHRAFGYAWVTLMLVASGSALFIPATVGPTLGGFGLIHLLVPLTLAGLLGSFVRLARGDIAGHRRIMQSIYYGACVVAGAFTLLPGRFLGDLLWVEWLGLLPALVRSGPPRGTALPVVQILAGTPVWVWGLLAALIVLGLAQARARSVGLARIALLPLGLGGFSLYGTVSAFGTSPAVLGSWLAATLAMLLVVAQGRAPAGARYDAASRSFHLPGSWVPMLLILGIFLTRYAVGAGLALQPELKAHANFSLAVGTVYGVFSGIFAGRALRLLRMALRPAAGRPVLTTA